MSNEYDAYRSMSGAERVAQSVKAGRLTPAQADRIAPDWRRYARLDAANKQRRGLKGADVMGGAAHGREAFRGAVQGGMIAAGSDERSVRLAGKALEPAGKAFGALGEGLQVRDELRAGRRPDVVAVRSGGRLAGAAGFTAGGRVVGGAVGGLIGGFVGLPAAGGGAVPVGMGGAAIGSGVGGFLGNLVYDVGGFDDRAADAAERAYLRARR